MRFIIVSLGWHPDIVGGAWRVAAEQARGLAQRGHSVEAVTAGAGADFVPREVRDGVVIHRYPRTPGSFLTHWCASNRHAAEILRQRLAASAGPALVIQHHAYLAPAVEKAAAGPVFHTFHGPWAEEYQSASKTAGRGIMRRAMDLLVPHVLRRVERRALRRARRILVLSRHFARSLATWHPGPLPPVEIVPGGVDFDRYQPVPDRASLRAEHGLGAGDYLFVATRRLDPRMGLDLLIEAFAGVAKDHPRARLWLTGRGPSEAGLKAQVARLGLEGSVRLLGFVSEPELIRLLNAADAAVMPSLELEGFGLATAEALACGTPVLGSRAGATPELLEPLDPALLFEPRSVPALAARLRQALDTPEKLPTRGRCATFARERFSWNAQVEACERAAAEFLRPSRPA